MSRGPNWSSAARIDSHMRRKHQGKDATMSDFAARISRSVEAARALAHQVRETQRQLEEGRADALLMSQRRASELAALIWEQIGVAEQASNGAIAAERSGGNSRTIFQVR